MRIANMIVVAVTMAVGLGCAAPESELADEDVGATSDEIRHARPVATVFLTKACTASQYEVARLKLTNREHDGTFTLDLYGSKGERTSVVGLTTGRAVQQVDIPFVRESQGQSFRGTDWRVLRLSTDVPVEAEWKYERGPKVEIEVLDNWCAEASDFDR